MQLCARFPRPGRYLAVGSPGKQGRHRALPVVAAGMARLYDGFSKKSWRPVSPFTMASKEDVVSRKAVDEDITQNRIKIFWSRIDDHFVMGVKQT